MLRYRKQVQLKNFKKEKRKEKKREVEVEGREYKTQDNVSNFPKE